MNSLQEVVDFLNNNETIEGELTVKFLERVPSKKSPSEIADELVTGLNFKPIEKGWVQREKEFTIELLTKMLHKSLAYHVDMLPLHTAEHIAKTITEHFEPWNTTYLSNGSIQNNCIALRNSISNSTMEMAVVIYDSKRIGVICVEDED